MKKEYSSQDVVHMLRAECAKRTQKDVARTLRVSPQYLNDILQGRREISADFAKKLGSERVVTFVRWSDEDYKEAEEASCPLRSLLSFFFGGDAR